jgi:hypothetical protein
MARRGKKKIGRWLGFKGSGGEGGPGGVDTVWRQSRREREGEREGALGATACRRCGNSPAAARCRATVEDGGVGATRSTWRTGGPGRDEGPVVSGWVRHGEAVGAALAGGVGSTVRPIRFSNRIKLISNGFKFDRFKRYLPLLQKFQIKYG